MHSARLREIFARGSYFEQQSRQRLSAAGFKFAPAEALGFNVLNGALRGNADGIIIAGPDLPGAYLIYPLLWEHKAINSKNWRALEHDGLEKTLPQYAAQVALYQAYLDITNPALFTALNADTCQRCIFWCRSTPSARSFGPTVRSRLSKQHVRANCCRAPTTTRKIGTAACAAITNIAGGKHEPPARNHRPANRPWLQARQPHPALGIEQRWRVGRHRPRNAACVGLGRR
jgi:hypothetical protein